MVKIIVPDVLFSEPPGEVPVFISQTDLKTGKIASILKRLLSLKTVGYITRYGSEVVGVILHAEQFQAILDKLEKLRMQVLNLEQENSRLMLDLEMEGKR